MPTPSYPVINQQPPTALRVYDYFTKKARFRSECVDSYRDCPYKLLTTPENFLPFQFVRPTSMEQIDSWEVYDLNDNLVLTLDADDIALLTITPKSGGDFITYNGGELSEALPEGFHYFTIETDGRTFYSEDFYVTCAYRGDDIVTDPTFAGGIGPDEDWTYGDPSGNTDFTNLVTDTIVTNGPPTDPAWEVTGTKIISFPDATIWEWNGAAWVDIHPANGTLWLDASTGSWYLKQAFMFSGVGSPPMVVTDGVSVCWNGTGSNAPFGIVADGTSTTYLIEFTVTGHTAGSLAIYGDDEGYLASGNGTFSFTASLENGSTIAIVPDADFAGCITDIHAYAVTGLEGCNLKLTWTNCGRVGNILYPELTQNIFYLPLDTLLPQAESELKVETEEDEDGERQEVSRHKETNWTVAIGLVPWFVVDALTEMCLHDTVKLHYPNGGGYDTLLHPSIEAVKDRQISACLYLVTLRFQIVNSNVACCEEFDAPCPTSCVTATGYTSDVSPTLGNQYLRPSEPRYAQYNGSTFNASVLCDSGLANIGDIDDDGYTVRFDLNEEEWVAVAENTLADVGDDCAVTLQFTILDGYSGILQYVNTDSEWVDDAEWNMSADEWFANAEERTLPEDQHEDNRVRLKVMCPNGTTVLGYSQEATYTCV